MIDVDYLSVMKHKDKKLALFCRDLSERAVLNPIDWIDHVERMYGKKHALDALCLLHKELT